MDDCRAMVMYKEVRKSRTVIYVLELFTLGRGGMEDTLGLLRELTGSGTHAYSCRLAE